MDEKEWQTFVTVVAEGNITKAADKLFLSQPALSYRLRHLEEDLGCPLLLRTNEGITLTPQGEVFHAYCRRMLEETESLKQSIGEMSGEIQGTLKIASSINFADYQLPHLLSLFTEKYPHIHMQVKSGYSSHVNKMFNGGEVMIAITRGNFKESTNSIKLFEEPYCLVYKDKVSIDDLASLPWIQYRTDGSISSIVESWRSENLPTSLEPAMELDSMVTCRHFVREGLGWAILPYLGLGSCKDEGIHVAPIYHKDGTPFMRSTLLHFSEVSTKLIAAKTFIDYVCEHYKDYTPVDIEF
ncbi:LysR family transcriptional regulator [Veillonella sp. R32]|uniref:LysR family transcriptional regulator n=1 Tax=Veillonella sp. R32 TaxID=2021312 RepID=UPI001389D99B|nr:LysR family transcriptional regulator [Veillonella sp. R32]KAF1683733.1 LysR family transcriptional regulator [Veillonella sp. R32]